MKSRFVALVAIATSAACAAVLELDNADYLRGADAGAGADASTTPANDGAGPTEDGGANDGSSGGDALPDARWCALQDASFCADFEGQFPFGFPLTDISTGSANVVSVDGGYLSPLAASCQVLRNSTGSSSGKAFLEVPSGAGKGRVDFDVMLRLDDFDGGNMSSVHVLDLACPASGSMYLRINAVTGKLDMTTSGANSNDQPAVALPVGKWTHVTGYFDPKANGAVGSAVVAVEGMVSVTVGTTDPAFACTGTPVMGVGANTSAGDSGYAAVTIDDVLYRF